MTPPAAPRPRVLMTLPEPNRFDQVLDEQQPPPFQPTPKDPSAYAGLIKTYLDRKSPYDHPLRLRRCSTFRRADLYDQSKQWLRPSFNLDPSRTMHWTEDYYDEDDPDWIPQPCYNEISTAFSNEAARLSKPEYKPYVRPSGENPDAKTKEAAKTAAEILTSELEEMNFDTRVADPGFRAMPQYGMWTLKSYMDLSWGDTVPYPVKTAMRCPECDFRVANPKLDGPAAAAVNEKYPGRVTFDAPQVEGAPPANGSLGVCLTCDDHAATETQDQPATDEETGEPIMGPDGAMVMVPTEVQTRQPGPPALEPYTPTGEEVHEQDSLGQSLADHQPRARWWLRTCSPYDMFWSDLGMTESLEDWREVLEIHVETLDWIRERFPKAAGQVKAEAAETLMQYHPIGGERIVYQGTTSGNGAFRNHCRVKESHKKPYMEPDGRGGWKINKGRSMMMAGNVLLLDGPYLIQSKRDPSKWVPRVLYETAPWELRSGGREKEGFSMAELLFDVQDNINEAKSQTQDTRQRRATPKWLYRRGMNLDYEEAGGAGSHWVYDADVEYPNEKPTEVGSTTIDSGVYQELEDDRDYFARASGHNDVESGNLPSQSLTAASAIQLLAEQSGERRRPRTRRIRKMLERVYRHGLELMHEFVLEPRTYRVKDDTGEWRDRTWSGATICGQTDVRIDVEPEHDTALTRRENMVTALNMHLLDPSNKRARAMMAKRLEIPQELTEDADMQYHSAEREFWDFLDLDREPVVDPDVDDHPAHKDQHGADAHSEKWRALERDANWDEALLWLWGWNDGGLFDGWEQHQGDLAQQGLAQALPPALELKILAFWGTLLKGTGYFQSKMRPPAEVAALRKVMRFRAHLAAHSKILDQQLAAAQMGAVQGAAPMAPATAAGAKPAPQRGPVEQPAGPM